MTKETTSSRTTLKPSKPRLKGLDISEIMERMQSTTTSLAIAEKFNKEHKNVIRDIKNILKKVSTEFGNINFERSKYLTKQNKSLNMYILSFDGFMMLAMGFTGKDVMEIKEWYISAFRKMAEYISNIEKYQTTIDLTKMMTDTLITHQMDKCVGRLYGRDVSIYQWLMNELNKNILGMTSKRNARKHFNDKRTSISIREMVRQHDEKLSDIYVDVESYLIKRVIPKIDLNSDDVFTILRNKMISYLELINN